MTIPMLAPGQLCVTGPNDSLFTYVRIKDNFMADCRNVVDGKRTSIPLDREVRMATPDDLIVAAQRIKSAAIFHPEPSPYRV